MKSVFQKPVYKKKYYAEFVNFFNKYIVTSRSEFIEYLNYYKTEAFDKVFHKYDSVCIDQDEVVTIDQIIEGENCIIYRICEGFTIKNEQEKLKIEKETDKTNDELKKQDELKRLAEAKREIKPPKEPERPKAREIIIPKKWWQFWK